MNAASGIGAINDLLQEYPFTHHDFADPESVHWFLEEIVSLYGDRFGTFVGSSVMLRISETDGGVALWLEGTEKSEKVFLDLCSDPQFIFEGRRWKATFHVFPQGGSVERWEIKGEFDLENRCKKIYTIDSRLIRPKGTFYHKVMGRVMNMSLLQRS